MSKDSGDPVGAEPTPPPDPRLSGDPALTEPRAAGEPGSLEPAPGEPTPALIPTGLDAVLAFVRHGESEWVAEGRFQGQGDPPLSDLGRRQALLTARRLARRTRVPALPLPSGPPRAIVHSPLARAAETAGLIARAVSGGRGEDAVAEPVPVVPEDGLLEIGQGDWEGLATAVVVEQWGAVLEEWRRDPLSAWAPNGESLPVVDLRVRVALRTLLADLATAPHAPAAGRSQVLGYADIPSDEPWSIVVGHDGVFKVAVLALLDMPLARFWTLPFALCGITIVEIRNGRPRLRLHNETAHLASLAQETAEARERARSGAL